MLVESSYSSMHFTLTISNHGLNSGHEVHLHLVVVHGATVLLRAPQSVSLRQLELAEAMTASVTWPSTSDSSRDVGKSRVPDCAQLKMDLTSAPPHKSRQPWSAFCSKGDGTV